MASWLLPIALIYFSLFCNSILGMSREQLMNSGKVFKKSCMNKNAISEEHLQMISKGFFPEDREVMCFIACLYTMAQGIKNNKINHEGIIKNVEMMFPDDMKKAVISTVQQCRGIAKKYKDICEASFYTTKCMYEADPKNFLFV